MDEFSPENLAGLNKGLIPNSASTISIIRKSRQTAPFLRGPVPMAWLSSAYRIGKGGGLLLGCFLWWVRGMTKTTKPFPVNISRLDTGQAISTKRRMIKKLEQAGLVRRCHKPGKRLVLEIIPIPKGKESPIQIISEDGRG